MDKKERLMMMTKGQSMRISKSAMLVFLVVLLSASTAHSKFTPEEWERMKKGEVVITEVMNLNPDGSGRMDFLAKLYIKATRQEVWKHIRDYNNFPEFMPRMKKNTILKQEGQVYWVRYELKIFWLKIVYHIRVDGVELYKRIEYKLDKTKKNHIKDTYGYWILEDAPGGTGTILSYSTFVDTGIPAPKVLVRKLAKMSLPNIVKNVRKRVESGGKWKRTDD